MEEKKKSGKKKKDEARLLLYLLLGLAVVALLVLLIGNKGFPKKEYYVVKDRVSKVEDGGFDYGSYSYKAVGWLQVQGTNIDYPVIYTDDYTVGYPAEPEHYVWLGNLKSDFTNHMRISGHNLFNLSSQPEISNDVFTRFEELMAFTYYDFAKDNKYIQFTYEGKELVYKIFAVSYYPNSKKPGLPVLDYYDAEDMNEFIQEMKTYSIYDYDIDVNENDYLISLNTCTRVYGNDRDSREFYVVGRLLRDGEKIDNYSVSKNNNYKEVEELMKGDDEDDEV